MLNSLQYGVVQLNKGLGIHGLFYYLKVLIRFCHGIHYHILDSFGHLVSVNPPVQACTESKTSDADTRRDTQEEERRARCHVRRTINHEREREREREKVWKMEEEANKTHRVWKIS